MDIFVIIVFPVSGIFILKYAARLLPKRFKCFNVELEAAIYNLSIA